MGSAAAAPEISNPRQAVSNKKGRKKVMKEGDG
jgi:hypothetical protein